MNASLVEWLKAEQERAERQRKASMDEEDEAFYSGMWDAYELTLKELGHGK